MQLAIDASIFGPAGEVQRDGVLVLLDPVHLLPEPENAARDGGQHPGVELRAQQIVGGYSSWRSTAAA